MPAQIRKKKPAALANRLVQDLRAAVQQRQPTKRKAPKPAVPRAPTVGSQGPETSLTKYAAALMHPFSPSAEGARYPEPYAAHTITRKMRMEYVITPSSTGDFDLCIQPHLVFSAFSSNGTVTGAPVVLAIGNQPAGVNYFGCISAANLAGLFKSYRIVGWGVRLKANTDFTRSGGRVIAAVIPASQQLPANFGDTGTLTDFYESFEVPNEALGSGRAVSTSVLSLPRGHQLAVSELLSESGAEVTFPIVSAAATNFLEAANEAREQGLVATTALGAIVGRTSIGFASAAGHSQLLLRGVGLNVSSGVLVAEVVYHVEGIPNPISGAQLVESPVRLPPASPAAVAAVVHAAATVPAVQYVSSKMKAAAGGWMDRAKGALASRAGQSAERAIGLGLKSLLL